MEKPQETFAEAITSYMVKSAINNCVIKSTTDDEATQKIRIIFDQCSASKKLTEDNEFNEFLFKKLTSRFPHQNIRSLSHKLKIAGSHVWLIKEYFKNIRDFNSQTDLDAIKELVKDEWHTLVSSGPCFENHFNGFINDVFIQKRTGNPYSAANLKSHIKIIHTNDNNIAGFITYYPGKESYWNIGFLAINEQWQSQGYGKKLIEYATYVLATNHAAQGVILNVFKDNPKAIGFYSHLGFKKQVNSGNNAVFTMKKEI